MKAKNISLILSLLLCSGTVYAADKYNPVIYNLSTLYDFNPVKGHVKELKTVMKNSEGAETYRLDMHLQNNGCLQSLEVEDKTQGFNLSLKGNGKELKGLKNDKPITFDLDDKCNLVSSKSGRENIEYQKDSNGFLKNIIFNGSKMATQFYDENLSLVKAEFYMSGNVASTNVLTYPDANHKPLDYKLVNSSPYASGYTAISKCQYNELQVPVKCSIRNYKDMARPDSFTELTALTKAKFY